MASGPLSSSKLQRGHSPIASQLPPPPPSTTFLDSGFLLHTLSSLPLPLVLTAFNHSTNLDGRTSSAELYKLGYEALERVIREILFDEFPALPEAALEVSFDLPPFPPPSSTSSIVDLLRPLFAGPAVRGCGSRLARFSHDSRRRLGNLKESSGAGRDSSRKRRDLLHQGRWSHSAGAWRSLCFSLDQEGIRIET